jgi:hypothetical protein
MEKFRYLILCIVVSFVSVNGWAQWPVDPTDEVWPLLDEKVQNRLLKAQKLMKKADLISEQTEIYEKQIETLRNERGRMKLGKIKRLEAKRNQSVLKSQPFAKDSYVITYKALYKQLKDVTDTNADAGSNSKSVLARDSYKQGKRLYRKADNAKNVQRQIEYLVLGGNKMREAITAQLILIGDLSNKTKAAKNEIEPKEIESTVVDAVESVPVAIAPMPILTDSVSATAVVIDPIMPGDTSVVTTDAAVVNEVEPTQASIAQPPMDVIDAKGVFITIQILSLQSAASPAQIKAAYSGNDKVVEIISGDYYRYTIGRFQSLEQAKQKMAADHIKGIVMAFRGNERISVAEAVTELKGSD